MWIAAESARLCQQNCDDIRIHLIEKFLINPHETGIFLSLLHLD